MSKIKYQSNMVSTIEIQAKRIEVSKWNAEKRKAFREQKSREQKS